MDNNEYYKLIRPFQDQIDQFLVDNIEMSQIQIGTLGPLGTSSEAAVNYFISHIRNAEEKSYQVCLYNNFQMVFDKLQKEEIDYALVPSAYSGITDFFWNPDFLNVLTFNYMTPPYGIVSLKGADPFKKDTVILAACDAVKNIKTYLLGEIDIKGKIERVTTNSTAEAALFVLEEIADISITNMSSYNRYNGKDGKHLDLITSTYSSYMVWTLFKKQKAEDKRNKIDVFI